MRAIRASAPGKLVLLGEYAVLLGYEALGAAVERRAEVSGRWIPEPRLELDLVPLSKERVSISSFLAESTPNSIRKAQWLAEIEQLNLDTHLSEAVMSVTDLIIDDCYEHWSQGDDFGIELRIDSHALYRQDGGKLGLGSSAAVSTALTGLLLNLMGEELSQQEFHHRIHQRHQSGVGSGLDLATSLVGGIITYRKSTDTNEFAEWAHLPKWPRNLFGHIVTVKHSVSTPALIQAFEAWKQSSASVFDKVMSQMGVCANQTAGALKRGDLSGFLEGFTEYGVRVGRMGELMGRELLTTPHQRILEEATKLGVSYKPCGAGGGDVGLLLSDNYDATSRACQRLIEIGFNTMPFVIAEDGLLVDGAAPWQ